MIKGISALELFKHETISSNRIKTFSRDLDNMFSGGIIIGRGIVELCGVPGTGKTQFCKQLSLNIQIPKSIGGPGLNAVYIEGNFSVNRIREISKSTLDYIKNKECDLDITVDKLISNVKYIRIFDIEELLNLLYVLPDICKNNNVGIVVIDSISMIIRVCNLENKSYRLKIQQKIAKQLDDISKKYGLSIVVTNHMTTRYFGAKNCTHINDMNMSDFNLEPSLGLSWSSLISDRLLLKHKKKIDSENNLSFFISATNKNGDSAIFKISENGIQDINE